MRSGLCLQPDYQSGVLGIEREGPSMLDLASQTRLSDSTMFSKIIRKVVFIQGRREFGTIFIFFIILYNIFTRDNFIF